MSTTQHTPPTAQSRPGGTPDSAPPAAGGLGDDALGAIEAVVLRHGHQLYDVVDAGGTISVLVESAGSAGASNSGVGNAGASGTAQGETAKAKHPGIDVDALAAVSRELSRLFDQLNPHAGSYTLEVSSPGLERRLRKPAHFAGAVGETITVRTTQPVNGERRIEGQLTSADDQGIVVDTTAHGTADGPVTLTYTEIDRARTVFSWGPQPKPTGRRR